ncbi:MAG: GTP-binding protein [Francisellaceae bacterium]|jgi:GTP-binding protein
MNYQNVTFMTSAAKSDQCPDDIGSEVAFAGRSNSGKSSALNTLTKHKALARVSKTPGRTQLINFFALEPEENRLVDLPGYGYAKVPVAVRKSWQSMLEMYLSKRESLKGIILLVDSRHPLKEFDLVMIQYALDLNTPIHLLLTKSDKLSNNQQAKTIMHVKKELQNKYQSDLCTVQLFSSLKNNGVDLLVSQLDNWFEK